MNDLVTTAKTALASLEQQETPEAKAIIEYVKAIEKKNIAVLGEDEAFVLADNSGEIKAFKKAVTMSIKSGTLVQPVYNGDLVVSAQGYEVLNEATGTSVIFPKEVLVGGEWKPNPYAERDPQNRRILAVHARAIAFRYSSMGIPQVSDWTTIFDTPSYRMIDLLAKAKKFPQCFKVLPKDMKPEAKNDETWASYPFDESMDLWINTSHAEVITWLSQILNREKKAMDFAQTFARRNASKHIHGIQKAPCDNWRFSVLAWRPTGNNIVKWDAAQYANLQNRVAGMIEGGTDEFKGQIEMQQGIERTSEDLEATDAEMEAEINQEDPVAEGNGQQADESGNQAQQSAKTEKSPAQKQKSAELSKNVRQALYLLKHFPVEFVKACEIIGADPKATGKLDDETASLVCAKVDELVDAQN